ncbi:MAG: citramalate synthase [Deltaproteobacteria bacterium]|nr:MAG: citramalate synthase [Deltaproteobacteria bacterium]
MIAIYDTTLRDGTQRDGLSLSLDDKLRIADRLDRLGVAYIEGGWPGSNPKDAELFARAKDRDWRHAKLAAFGSTRRAGTGVEDDANLRALVEAGTPVCTIFGKSWTRHVTEVLRTTFDENLALIEESVAYLKAHGREVIYDAEHFFDGYKADPAYAFQTLEAAQRGGADAIVLCDTNGGALPWEIEQIVGAVAGPFSVVGIHCHNDSGCAVANSLAAVRAGAVHVQGTVNGYGERCGNADLCAVVANLELKLGRRCLPDGGLRHLYDVAHFVAEVANLAPDEHAPYVGRSAFAHKGGVHVAAIRRNPGSYEHVPPDRVGNRTRVVVSELSGRGNLLAKAEEHAVDAPDDVRGVLAEVKANEAQGFSYEAAEASVALLLARRADGYRPPYRLIDYMVNVEHRDGRGTFAEATVKVEVAGEVVHTAAEGDGPVHALDRALRKALAPVFPAIDRIQLVDYKVRILDGDHATGAITRVLIDCTDGTRHWSTVGASPNIIDASWRALTDAIEYGLRAAGGADERDTCAGGGDAGIARASGDPAKAVAR